MLTLSIAHLVLVTIVEDYNPAEGDTVTADCETVQDTNAT